MSEFDDDPIARALRAPGTPEELAGEAEALAAFRAAARGRGRLVRRLGAGGAGGIAAVVVVALSGGVAAAAYTNQLPEPVQRIAHHALGSIGVPDPAPEHHSITATPVTPPTQTPGAAASATQSASPTGSPTVSPTPTPSPTRQVSKGATPTVGAAPSTSPTTGPVVPVEPSEPAQPTEPTEPTAPSQPTGPIVPVEPSQPGTSGLGGATGQTTGSGGSGTPSATSAPSPTGQPAVAAVSIELGTGRVLEGAAVSVGGTVTDAGGDPLAGRRVVLDERVTDGDWKPVAHGHTGADGRIALSTPPLIDTGHLRLVAQGTTSARLRVVVVPTLSATYVDGIVAIRTNAARAGEKVEIAPKGGGQTVTATLDATGHAAIAITVASGRRSTRYVVVLPGTAAHARATTTVVVPGTGTPDPGRTPGS
jgi:hypothetical protein